MRKSTFGGHLMSHKTPKQNRQHRRSEVVDASDVKRIKHLVPYL